jgi:hypothetical protein
MSYGEEAVSDGNMDSPSEVVVHYPNLHAEHYQQTVNTIVNLSRVLEEDHLYLDVEPVFLPEPND